MKMNDISTYVLDKNLNATENDENKSRDYIIDYIKKDCERSLPQNNHLGERIP